MTTKASELPPVPRMPGRYRYNGGHWMTRQPILTAIPGREVQIGDRVWPTPDQVFTVESIRLNNPCADPQLVAAGPGVYFPGTEREFTARASEPFHLDMWVVVER